MILIKIFAQVFLPITDQHIVEISKRDVVFHYISFACSACINVVDKMI